MKRKFFHKKHTAAILLTVLLLTGCGQAQPIPVTTVMPVGTETSLPVETVPVTEMTIPVETTEALEMTEPVVSDEAVETTEAVGTTDSPVLAAPSVTEPTTAEQPGTEAEPVQPPQPPAPPVTESQPKPAQPATPPVSGRPTSSATCRDTGSDEIWVDPTANGKDYYEETDPERTDYLEYLKAEGNEFYFWIVEEDMRMFVGRTYGIPVYSSYKIVTEGVWASSDPTVATVNQVGFVTPLKPGNTVISISHTEPETQMVYTRICRVTVKEEPVYTYAQLEQRAREEAQSIAAYVMGNPAYKTDLERIAVAALLVNQYVAEGVSTSNVPGYNQPFGTLVTFYSSCAGSTRAMGLVLEYMGFQWYHVNENQWEHQWCVVYDVDGQTAFADGSVYGIAGYGQRQPDRSNWMQYRNGALQPF